MADDESIEDILGSIDDSSNNIDQGLPAEAPAVSDKPKEDKKTKKVSVDDAINRILTDFEAKESEMWSNLTKDRQVCDKYLTIFTNKFLETNKSVLIEAITSLVNSKATNSLQAARYLDSKTKMLSVLKNMKEDDGDDGMSLEDMIKDVGNE